MKNRGIKMKYTEKYRNIGLGLVELFEKEGIIQAGVNGPYDDQETIVRNLSHLIIITSLEILIFNNKRLRNSLDKMGEKLLSMKTDSGLYIMRKKNTKDKCNGVIGHAWVIESLVYLFRVTYDEKYLIHAKEIVDKHAFDNKEFLWHRPLYGQSIQSDVSIDYTLNHQLWFAASLAELNQILKDEKIDFEVNNFLDDLSTKMWIHRDGLICHPIYMRTDFYAAFKEKIKFSLDVVRRILGKPSYKYREYGYHIFNLMALARINRVIPEHKFFSSRKFLKTLKFVNDYDYLKKLLELSWKLDSTLNYKNLEKDEYKTNIYGYTYNVNAFELWFIRQNFENMIDLPILEKALSDQDKIIYDEKEQKLGLESHDKIVINYRVYELYRCLEKDKNWF